MTNERCMSKLITWIIRELPENFKCIPFSFSVSEFTKFSIKIQKENNIHLTNEFETSWQYEHKVPFSFNNKTHCLTSGKKIKLSFWLQENVEYELPRMYTFVYIKRFSDVLRKKFQVRKCKIVKWRGAVTTSSSSYNLISHVFPFSSHFSFYGVC